MSKGHLYKNSPLVEVVAELFWRMRTVDASLGIQVDPYYYLFQEQFVQEAKHNELSCEELIVPNFVPLEHIPNKPRIRLKASPSSWPVVQIGPGIISINTAPPYSGWSDFSDFLQRQVKLLFQVSKRVGHLISIEKLRLQYIDGFGDTFNFNHFPTFIQEMLEVSIPLKENFLNKHVKDQDKLKYTVDVSFDCTTPTQTTGRLKIAPGMLNNKEAAIMTLSCEIVESDSIKEPTQINHWFSDAHNTILNQFHSLTTAKLEKLMKTANLNDNLGTE